MEGFQTRIQKRTTTASTKTIHKKKRLSYQNASHSTRPLIAKFAPTLEYRPTLDFGHHPPVANLNAKSAQNMTAMAKIKYTTIQEY